VDRSLGEVLGTELNLTDGTSAKKPGKERARGRVYVTPRELIDALREALQ
jgi:hypothetical protein